MRCFLKFVAIWLILLPLCAHAQAGKYLPMEVGDKWILRNSRFPDKPVTFEVTQKDGNGYRILSTTPWNTSEWTLEDESGKVYMTAYGNGEGRVGPTPKNTLFFDFTGKSGSKWSNKMGKLSVTSTSMTVRANGRTFSSCIQVKHDYGGGANYFSFAPGVGFVQFGEGANAFVLDVAASSLPGSVNKAGVPDVASTMSGGHGRDARSGATATNASVNRGGGRPVIGMTFNQLATDPGPQAILQRFDQVKETGANYIMGNADWRELEPKKGHYKLDGLNYLASIARPAGMEVSYTVRVINNLDRGTPDDLRKVSWTDPKMKKRLFALLDAMAPMLRGNVQWFMLGYECNEYFKRHPKEVNDFISLFQQAKAHLQEKVPGLQVSTTLMFSGLGDLDGKLAALNSSLDFLALTYTPLNPDFSVQDPSVVGRDFAQMKSYADGRKIIFQEIGYPSSPVTGSSDEKQAQFYRTAFQEIRRDLGAFSAVNWMMLGDLSDSATKQISSYFGGKGVSKFEAVLQTMGVFDKQGKPKKSWDVFREQIKNF